MANLNVLLGAGFSAPAGYPTGGLLNQKFFVNMEDKMLRMSSGEWVWDDYDDATSNNGRLNYKYLNISYLLSEFVEMYQQEYFKVFNYEEFYDWFKELYGNQELIEKLSEKVNARLRNDFGIDDTSEHIIKDPNINQYRNVYESFNYLIGDLLGRNYKRETKKSEYKPILDFFKEFENVNIFTLNHDLLMEYLLYENSVNFSDGFSSLNSIITGQNNEKLEVFINSFPEKVKLFKLHGSVNYYCFEEIVQDGMLSRRTDNYWFFKPNSYHNKHYAKRINPVTNEIIQQWNWNTVPQFLTGKNKKDFLTNQNFYKDIYKTYINSFENCDTLLIHGYSFSDLHINSVIKNSLDKYEFKIININRSRTFPFRKNYSTDFVKDIKSIAEL